MNRKDFSNFRFYYFPSSEELKGRLNSDNMLTYICDKCGWSGTETSAMVDDGETHIRYLCPKCGLVLGGVVESLEAFAKDKPRMEHVLDNLDRVANLIKEELPIVFLPLIQGNDPLQGKCALVLRKPEFKEELEKLYETGRISMAEGEKPIQ